MVTCAIMGMLQRGCGLDTDDLDISAGLDLGGDVVPLAGFGCHEHHLTPFPAAVKISCPHHRRFVPHVLHRWRIPRLYARPVNRGLPPPRRTSASRSRADMIRETHPDDFDVADLPPLPRPPSGLVIVLPIALGLAALVLVAALHAALGAPLGVAWGQEVWSLVKAAVWPTIACASIGAYVRGQAMLAERALPPPLPPGSPTGRRL